MGVASAAAQRVVARPWCHQSRSVRFAFTSPKGNATLSYPTGHAQFDLRDGGSTPLVSHRIAVSTADRVTLDDASTDGLTLKINHRNGVITGSFIHPASGKRSRLSGAIYQQTNRATGFFTGPAATGRFELRPE